MIRIAVTPLWNDENKELAMTPEYLTAVEAAGALPLVLPLTTDESLLRTALDGCDGLLLTGGHDVDPALYGAALSPACGPLQPERDKMEAFLYGEALRQQKPILAICRGMQLVNVLQGGTLYQDLPSEWKQAGSATVQHNQAGPYNQPSHRVSYVANTPLALLAGQPESLVNSMHHQGVCRLGSDLQVMARSEDGLVEAFCLETAPFAWGVQWHPEYEIPGDTVGPAIFYAFIGACRAASVEK